MTNIEVKVLNTRVKPMRIKAKSARDATFYKPNREKERENDLYGESDEE